MKTSIVIVAFNKLEFTRPCIESIRTYTEQGTYEIIVVDNGSSDGTADWLRRQDDLVVISNTHNAGFPRGCNQGMEIAQGELILLLNNDTLATHHWLENLKRCICSDERIGAVGPVTNSASYSTSIQVSYRTKDEMHAFAKSHNVSDPAKWEERLKLIGFCLLVKREAIRRTGMFDERYGIGNFEDDDLCLRLRNYGYRLLLCRDTFVYHHGSATFNDDVSHFSDRLIANCRKFEEKWGVNPISGFAIRNDLLTFIDKTDHPPVRILEIGCGLGGTLLQLKNRFPGSELYGVEENKHAAAFASTIGETVWQTADPDEWTCPRHFFDYILIGNSYSFAESPQNMKRLLRFLKKNGKVIAIFPNRLHYRRIKKWLEGQWPGAEKGIGAEELTPLFSLQETDFLFREAGFKQVQNYLLIEPISGENEAFVQALSGLAGPEMKDQYQASSIVAKAYRTEPAPSAPISETVPQTAEIVRELETGSVDKEKLANIATLLSSNQMNVDDIVRVPIQDSSKRAELLLAIAEACYYGQINEPVIPLLNAAYDLRPDHPDILYNLGFMLYKAKRYEEAIRFFEAMEEKDDAVAELIREIQNTADDENRTNLIYQMEQNGIPFTGERLVINKEVKEHYRGVMEEHIARYDLATRYVPGKKVLDAACGAGYGTKMMEMAGASEVNGIDVSEESILHAIPAYKGEKSDFMVGDVHHLPFEDGSFDVVVSFETIEHIPDGSAWIRESARVLRQDGIFIVSTPNRSVTNPGIYLEEQPMNSFHRFEYTIAEFLGELLTQYELLAVYGQTIIPDRQSSIFGMIRRLRNLNTEESQDRTSGSGSGLVPLAEIKNGQPMYTVAVCRKREA